MSWMAAAGSVIGGILGKGQSAGKATNDVIRNQAAGARRWGAAYGFNPLTLLGVSSGMNAQPGNGMGQAVSDAFQHAADALSKDKAVTQKLNQYQQENDSLRQQVNHMTLRPEIPGRYGNVSVPAVTAPGGVAITSPNKYVAMREAYEPLSEDVVSGADGVSAIKKIPGKLFGMDLLSSGKFSDGSWGEEGYGDFMGAVLGIPSFASDLSYTAMRAATGTHPQSPKKPAGEETEFVLSMDDLSAKWRKETERPPKSKRRDLREWPWNGLNPFGQAYQ